MIGLGLLGLGLTGSRIAVAESGGGGGAPAWVTSGGFDDWVDYDEGVSSTNFSGLLSGNYINLPQSIQGGISWYIWCETTGSNTGSSRAIMDFSDGTDTNRHYIYRDTSMGGPRCVNGNYHASNLLAGTWDGSANQKIQLAGSYANGFARMKYNAESTVSGSGALGASAGSTITKLGIGTKGFTSASDMTNFVKHRVGVIYGAGNQTKFDAIIALFT